MKARTINQKRITELSKRFPELNEDQEKYVFDHSLEHRAFANKTNAGCLDCGKTFSLKLIKRKRATCPHCKTKVKVDYTQKRTWHQEGYAAMALVVEEYQVVRHFHIQANYKKGRKVKYHVYEVIQYWVSDKKFEMIGRNYGSGFFGNGSCWTGDWSIRKNGSGYYYNGARYRVYPDLFLPGSKFKRKFTKIGINAKIIGLMVTDLMDFVPKNPQAETLLKAKQLSLLQKCRDYPNEISEAWPSIKICLRNKYKVKDAGIWFDYLENLRDHGKDLRNAKYVCPPDLTKAHNKEMNRRRKIQEKAQAIRDKERARKEEIKKAYLAKFPYEKRKQAYMGLGFSHGKIKIKFLESVEEIEQEGKELYHCVYKNKYQDKTTLLFSASIGNNKIATAEVDPDILEVVQVRGYDNIATAYDNKIISVLNKNMGKIRKRKQKAIELKSEPDLSTLVY